MVGMQVGGDNAKSYVTVGCAVNVTTGEDASSIAVNQQGQQQGGVLGCGTVARTPVGQFTNPLIVGFNAVPWLEGLRAAIRLKVGQQVLLMTAILDETGHGFS